MVFYSVLTVRTLNTRMECLSSISCTGIISAMDTDLKEALEAIKHLRAALQLACFSRDDIDLAQVDEAMDAGRAVLEKHGEPDDMMDAANGD